MEQLLKDIYFNPKNPASFSSVERLYLAAHSKDPTITREVVTQWLHGQDTYTLNKPARRTFKRSRVITTGMHVQQDLDLADVSGMAEANDDVHFLLIAIDVFSRKLYVQPLKSKRALDVVQGLEKLWGDDPIPALVRTDRGLEFTNKASQAFFKANDVRHFTTNNYVKANFAERVIRSLRMRIHRLITYRQNERFIDDLQAIVGAYNGSVHSGIGMAPSDVNSDNQRAVWYTQYWVGARGKKPKPFVHAIGAYVRISYLKMAFTRGYDYQYSGEIFKVIGRLRRDTLPVYKIEDLNGDRVEGTFYCQELVAAPRGDDDIWKVERIIRRRKRKGHKKEVLIKWLHFPSKFNSWVDEDSVVDIR